MRGGSFMDKVELKIIYDSEEDNYINPESMPILNKFISKDFDLLKSAQNIFAEQSELLNNNKFFAVLPSLKHLPRKKKKQFKKYFNWVASGCP